MNATLGITDGIMKCDKDGCSSFWILSGDESWTLSELIETYTDHVTDRHNK